MPIEERLRKNAELIARQVGGDRWIAELAEEMRCGVAEVGMGPVSRTRDSEPLAESNFRVVLRDLRSIDERVTTMRFRHWGFGWWEEIAVPLDNPQLIDRVGRWVEQLESYPVADETDLADLEAEDDTAEGLPVPPALDQHDDLAQLRRRLDSPGASTDPPGLGL
ncbi:MAG: hypothetical protein ACRD2C_25230 [Acidimicrobiales bacterium]